MSQNKGIFSPTPCYWELFIYNDKEGVLLGLWHPSKSYTALFSTPRRLLQNLMRLYPIPLPGDDSRIYLFLLIHFIFHQLHGHSSCKLILCDIFSMLEVSAENPAGSAKIIEKSKVNASFEAEEKITLKKKK